jgi:glycogen phosphorylase
VTAAFRDLGLEVAKASVEGDQAVVDDRFFVSYGEGGGKLLDASDAASVKRALEALLLRGSGAPGSGGAGDGGAASAAARKAARPKFSTVSMQLDSSKRELLYTLMDTYRKNDVLSIQESIVGHVEYTLARTRYQFDDREAYQVRRFFFLFFRFSSVAAYAFLLLFDRRFRRSSFSRGGRPPLSCRPLRRVSNSLN